jgi:hypothetical protein
LKKDLAYRKKTSDSQNERSSNLYDKYNDLKNKFTNISNSNKSLEIDNIKLERDNNKLRNKNRFLIESLNETEQDTKMKSNKLYLLKKENDMLKDKIFQSYIEGTVTANQMLYR